MEPDKIGCATQDKRQDHGRREIIKKSLSLIIGKDQCTDQYDVACFALKNALPGAELEVLGQLVKNGPVWDGDICSKAARDNLISMGLASRAYFRGDDGYTVANYRGGNVYKAMA